MRSETKRGVFINSFCKIKKGLLSRLSKSKPYAIEQSGNQGTSGLWVMLSGVSQAQKDYQEIGFLSSLSGFLFFLTDLFFKVSVFISIKKPTGVKMMIVLSLFLFFSTVQAQEVADKHVAKNKKAFTDRMFIQLAYKSNECFALSHALGKRNETIEVFISQLGELKKREERREKLKLARDDEAFSAFLVTAKWNTWKVCDDTQSMLQTINSVSGNYSGSVHDMHSYRGCVDYDTKPAEVLTRVDEYKQCDLLGKTWDSDSCTCRD